MSANLTEGQTESPIKGHTKGRFLISWSILNLAGWVVGIYLLVLFQSTLEYHYEFIAWKTFLTWFPMGASIGLFQWFKLRRLGISLAAWVLVTALGGSIFVTFYSWVLNFGSFDYREYNIPDWVINTCLAITMPIGGATIGSLQSAILRKRISGTGPWIRAYTLGFLPPPMVTPLVILVKSFFLHLLLSTGSYILVASRWHIFLGFLTIFTAVFISILTGNVLLKHSNINSVTPKAD